MSNNLPSNIMNNGWLSGLTLECIRNKNELNQSNIAPIGMTRIPPVKNHSKPEVEKCKQILYQSIIIT